MTHHPHADRRQPVPHQRIVAIAVHIPRYSVRGLARLSRDAGIDRKTLWRLVSGKSRPSLAVTQRIVEALSHAAGRPIPFDEVVSATGSYPTECPCALFGCRCLPPWAYAPDGSRKPAYRAVKPGTWTESGPSTDLE